MRSATDVLALDDEAFAQALTRAFDARLGEAAAGVEAGGVPAAPATGAILRAGRVLVMGDAAHVVHPLAGQGVNLGLRDVAGLRDMIVAAQQRRADWSSPHRLARWARTRKSENALAAHAFDGINRMFSSDGMHRTLLRGPLARPGREAAAVDHGLVAARGRSSRRNEKSPAMRGFSFRARMRMATSSRTVPPC